VKTYVKEFHLTAEQRAEGRYRMLAFDQYRTRYNVLLQLDDGRTPAEVSRERYLDEDTVRAWRDRCLSGGLDAVGCDGYRPGHGRLDAAQLITLTVELCDKIYTHATAVRQFIAREFGVELKERGIAYLWHRLGFSWKQPVVQPVGADPEKQAAFRQDVLAPLLEKEASEIQVIFTDAAHPTHNAQPARVWLPKGKETTVLPTNSGRQRLNMLNATERQGATVMMRSYETINRDTALQFLKAAVKRYPDAQEIHLISDNAKYFHAKKVQEFVAADPRLKMHFLLPYSPNLNLSERPWQLLHREVLQNRFYPTVEAFKNKVRDFFRRSKRDYGNKLCRLLNGDFHRFPTRAEAVPAVP
jgi:transposase